MDMAFFEKGMIPVQYFFRFINDIIWIQNLTLAVYLHPLGYKCTKVFDSFRLYWGSTYCFDVEAQDLFQITEENSYQFFEWEANENTQSSTNSADYCYSILDFILLSHSDSKSKIEILLHFFEAA